MNKQRNGSIEEVVSSNSGWEHDGPANHRYEDIVSGKQEHIHVAFPC